MLVSAIISIYHIWSYIVVTCHMTTINGNVNGNMSMYNISFMLSCKLVDITTLFILCYITYSVHINVYIPLYSTVLIV